jgi:hypothetical protein
MALPIVLTQSAIVILGGSAISLVAAGGISVVSKYRTRRVLEQDQLREQIKQLVNKQFSEGKSLIQIKRSFVEAGLNEKLVKEVIGTFEVYHYAYHNLRTGHSALKVKQALLNFGWEEEPVNTAIVQASHRLTGQKTF